MWTRNFSKTYTKVKKEDIWSLWTNINNWPKWHNDLDYCTLEGDFAVGNYFILKPRGVRPVKILLTEIINAEKFTDCTIFPGAKMYNTHAIEETTEGLILSNTIVVTGPLKWLWITLVAQKVADSIPEETEVLVRLARSMCE